MAVPTFTMRQLLEAGVHFGHHTRRWNPRMAPYIYGSRNGIHIVDLRQTVPLMYQALEHVRDVTANGGRVLFVGTKRAASDIVAEGASRAGQYYVNHRWLGGMLTNWKTISLSIKTLLAQQTRGQRVLLGEGGEQWNQVEEKRRQQDRDDGKRLCPREEAPRTDPDRLRPRRAGPRRTRSRCPGTRPWGCRPRPFRCRAGR